MTTNTFLTALAERLNIRNFRGVFMRDTLPDKPLLDECGIMNFDLEKEPGSHWVCWYKKGKEAFYFDSYGTAVPEELRDYVGLKFYRSDFMIQGITSDICGELCLTFLYHMDKGDNEQLKKIQRNNKHYKK